MLGVRLWLILYSCPLDHILSDVARPDKITGADINAICQEVCVHVCECVCGWLGVCNGVIIICPEVVCLTPGSPLGVCGWDEC